MLEARRYRYFNVWRARARWLETHFYAPLLYDGDLHMEENWQQVLAEDYLHPRYHVGFLISIGRRIRRNYLWILLIQSMAFAGKLAIHPTPVTSLDEALSRADVGPLPGSVIVAFGAFYVVIWSAIALWSYRVDVIRSANRGTQSSDSMG
mgnify:FL=1